MTDCLKVARKDINEENTKFGSEIDEVWIEEKRKNKSLYFFTHT